MKDLFKTLFAICLIVGTLASCDKENDPLDPDEPGVDPIQLATPEPQATVDGWSINVSWSEVEHAAYYMVRLNEGDAIQCESTTTTFTDLAAGDYTIEVQAIAEAESNYTDSEWGKATVTVVAPGAVQLATPELQATVGDSSIKVSWGEVENAVHYMVRLNGEEAVKCESTEIEYTNLEPGDYTIEVRAVAEEDSNFANSAWGKVTATVVAPDAVQLATPQPQVQVDDLNLSITAFWGKVEHAAYYMVRLNEGEATKCESTATNFTALTPGDYTIEVQAIAEEGGDYTNSEWGKATATLAAPLITFEVAISNLDAISCTVTCTPSDLNALYIFNTLPKSDYDKYGSGEEFIESVMQEYRNQSANAGITLEEGLTQVTSTGVDVWEPSGLKPATEYIVYAFGLTPQGVVTTPLTVVPFTTLSLPSGDMIEIFDVQETSFGIKIKAEGYNWICSVADKGVFAPYEGKEANYLISFGAKGYGNYTYTPENIGAIYTDKIRAGGEYVVLAAFCNEQGTGLGPITRVDVKTLTPPPAAGTATIEVTNIQDFFADVTITPSEGVDHYRVLVTEKNEFYATITANAAEYGMTAEEVCAYFIHDLNYAQKDYTGTYTLKATDYGTYMSGKCKWAANTEYWVGVVLYDKEGGRTYMETFFKTLPLQN